MTPGEGERRGRGRGRDEQGDPDPLGQRGGGAVARSTSRRSPRTSSPRSTGSWSASISRRPRARTRRTQARPPRRAHGHAPHAAQQPADRRRPDQARAPAPARPEAPARPAVRHLRLDGALRARVPAVPARGARERPRPRGVRLRDAPDAPDEAARRAQPAARDPARDGGRRGLVERHADRRRAEDVQRPLRPSRHGARLGHRHPVRRLGARRSRDRRRARWSAWRAWPTGSCGSTRASAPRASQPKAGGLVAALPYCNALVSGHSLKALDEVADAIAAEHDDDALGSQLEAPVAATASRGGESWGVAGSGSIGIAMPSNLLGIVPKGQRRARVAAGRTSTRTGTHRPMTLRSLTSPGSPSKRRSRWRAGARRDVRALMHAGARGRRLGGPSTSVLRLGRSECMQVSTQIRRGHVLRARAGTVVSTCGFAPTPAQRSSPPTNSDP